MFDVPFLVLDSGRAVFLSCLHQEPTYAGLLSGVATRERNERWITQWKERASKEFHDGHGAVVIATPSRSLSVPERLRGIFDRQGTVPEAIPRITCIGVLESHQSTASEPGEMFSSVAVVWFQEALAMPLDPQVEEALKAFDWDAHAWAWTP